jgi:predicted DCC family thiol-disulfide oxidoreductase YuxK
VVPVTDAPTTLPRYTVFYDANCRLCVRSRRTLERLRPRAALVFVNVQDDAAMRTFPAVDREASLGQMFVLNPRGNLAGGYDGFLSLVPTIPILRPLRQILRWRPVRFVGWKLYRFVARNRYRLGGAVSCESGVCTVAPFTPPPASAPRVSR